METLKRHLCYCSTRRVSHTLHAPSIRSVTEQASGAPTLRQASTASIQAITHSAPPTQPPPPPPPPPPPEAALSASDSSLGWEQEAGACTTMLPSSLEPLRWLPDVCICTSCVCVFGVCVCVCVRACVRVRAYLRAGNTTTKSASRAARSFVLAPHVCGP